MSQRMTQLLARYIGTGLIALATALGIEDDGTLVANGQAIAAGIAGVVAFLVDVWMHRIATGGVMKPAGTSKVAPVLLALLMLGAGGCAMTPSQRYQMLSDSYQTSANTTASLIRLGVITDTHQLEDIRQINIAMHDELTLLHDAITNDIPLDYLYIRHRVEALLGRLIQYQLDAEKETTDDTSTSNRTGPGHDGRGHEARELSEASEGRSTRLDPGRARLDQAWERSSIHESGLGDQRRSQRLVIARAA